MAMIQDMALETRRTVIGATDEEHGHITEAQHRLEAALTKAAQAGNRKLAAQVESEVEELLKSLQAHVDSAEGPGGLLAEIEKAVIAINDRIVGLLKDHRRLLDDCTALRSLAQRYKAGDKESLRDLRHSLAALINEIRQHQARESSLIDDIFCGTTELQVTNPSDF
jgi:hemerythrin-like domain-containing protein